MARLRPLTVLLAAIAVVLVVVGIVYVTTQCQHIPAPLPGREAGSTRHRIGFAVVAWVVAAAALTGAFFSARPHASSH